MKEADVAKIRKKLAKQLDDKRYSHTISVSYISTALAMRYDYDLRKAELAGLLHDCGKIYDSEKMLAYCEKWNISINDYEREAPELLHAKVGSFLAVKQFKVNDNEIIDAILNHTTGCPNMSLLEKIIFVADYIEPYRNKALHLSEIRKMAFIDLDRTILMITQETLSYLKASKYVIDPMTESTYNYYKQLVNQTEE